ncbi:MAG: hypothetical protein ACK4JD_10825 [Thermoflexales bacterium]
MDRRKRLSQLAAALLASLSLGAATYLSRSLNIECGCEYGNCGCRPIGEPHITPQQVTPLGPTLQPYTPYPIVTPALPQPATPALPALPTFDPPRPPANPTPPFPTPFPQPPTATPFGAPSAPSLPPIGGGCPFLVQRLYPDATTELYRVFFPTNSFPILIAITPPSFVYGVSYIVGAGWEFYVQVTAPYPPEYMTITITQGLDTYTCVFRRVY